MGGAVPQWLNNAGHRLLRSGCAHWPQLDRHSYAVCSAPNCCRHYGPADRNLKPMETAPKAQQELERLKSRSPNWKPLGREKVDAHKLAGFNHLNLLRTQIANMGAWHAPTGAAPAASVSAGFRRAHFYRLERDSRGTFLLGPADVAEPAPHVGIRQREVVDHA